MVAFPRLKTICQNEVTSLLLSNSFQENAENLAFICVLDNTCCNCMKMYDMMCWSVRYHVIRNKVLSCGIAEHLI